MSFLWLNNESMSGLKLKVPSSPTTTEENACMAYNGMTIPSIYQRKNKPQSRRLIELHSEMLLIQWKALFVQLMLY